MLSVVFFALLLRSLGKWVQEFTRSQMALMTIEKVNELYFFTVFVGLRAWMKLHRIAIGVWALGVLGVLRTSASASSSWRNQTCLAHRRDVTCRFINRSIEAYLCVVGIFLAQSHFFCLKERLFVYTFYRA